MRKARNEAAIAGLALLTLGIVSCGPTSALPLPTALTPEPTPARSVPPVVVGPYVAEVTLSGVVYETTATGSSPLEGATVYCDACGEQGHTWANTDARGLYTFTGIWLPFNPVPLHVEKEGYDDPPGLPALKGAHRPTGSGWREVTISGHTRFDMHLMRRQ